mgnify:CR=1 FL=1
MCFKKNYAELDWLQKMSHFADQSLFQPSETPRLHRIFIGIDRVGMDLEQQQDGRRTYSGH